MTEWDADVTKADLYGGVSYISAMLSTILSVQSVALEWYGITLLCMACTVMFALYGNASWHDGSVRAVFERVGIA